MSRLLKTIKLFGSSGSVGVKYSRNAKTARNWGDALNDYIISRMSGKSVVHYSEYFNLGLFPTIAGIGSILDDNHVRNLYVWGSGLKSNLSKLPVLPTRVFAVRGPLTRSWLLNAGVSCPEVYGDPALLIRNFYQPNRDVKYELGIVAHYADKNFPSMAKFKGMKGVTLINVESGIQEFVDDIVSCRYIASSSLHGLIAADAYNIPRTWVKFSGKIAGGDFKFMDYFATTDQPKLHAFASWSESSIVERIVESSVLPKVLPDLNELESAFPR